MWKNIIFHQQSQRSISSKNIVRNPKFILLLKSTFFKKYHSRILGQLKRKLGTQQVNETMHQRQPPSNIANTTEQPLVQAEGNNQQRETEKREPQPRNKIEILEY
ncbi:Hypothetical_protein [Hexamita inflata]|uniref:Hypothetical_protein n=1 Tax=Hexamita inflata TaxID=28002 RepID=A0AA86R661_9EUKA|nr:Hypothetical protein HINF_LOCUS54638 [Hexamita inflata]